VQYFDSDFAWTEVVSAGREAVAGHGACLPAEQCEALESEAAKHWDTFYGACCCPSGL
jgi:hypothetical protein